MKPAVSIDDDRVVASFPDARLASGPLQRYGQPTFDRDSRIRLNRLIIGVAVAAVTSGAAFAEDTSTPSQNGTLPGVASEYRIAMPAPEPDDAVPSNGQFKIGDTDVRISGSITFDVGAGAIKAPRR